MYAIRSYYAIYRDGELARLKDEFLGVGGAVTVITSYSIHYTKLYELRYDP